MTKARWFAVLLLIVFFLPVSDGGGVVPPITPPPVIDPPVVVVPPPIPDPGIHVLIVEESAARKDLTEGQREILLSQSWRTWLAEHRGTGRVLDTDQADNLANDKLWVQEAMKRQRDSLPWLVVSNGTTGFEGPLPGTLSEFLAILTPLGE